MVSYKHLGVQGGGFGVAVSPRKFGKLMHSERTLDEFWRTIQAQKCLLFYAIISYLLLASYSQLGVQGAL